MVELTKNCIVVHRNGIIQIMEINFKGKCTPGKGFDSAEFDTEELLNEYIASNNLITRDEAINKIAVLDNQIVDTEKYLYDAILFDSKEEAESYIASNTENN